MVGEALPLTLSEGPLSTPSAPFFPAPFQRQPPAALAQISYVIAHLYIFPAPVLCFIKQRSAQLFLTPQTQELRARNGGKSTKISRSRPEEN